MRSGGKEKRLTRSLRRTAFECRSVVCGPTLLVAFQEIGDSENMSPLARAVSARCRSPYDFSCGQAVAGCPT
jgi:hypothetical protein